MPHITLNGLPRAAGDDASIADLLQELGVPPQVVAVQLNDDIVPRDRFATTRLGEGDRVEVITFAVGG